MYNPTNKREIESLIYLLDDPDPEVQTGIRKRFKELGENAIPFLDQYRNESIVASEIDTISSVIYDITYTAVLEEFSEILEKGVTNRDHLEQALLTLSKFGDPTIRIGEYQKKLDQLSSEIGREISYTPSIVEKMQIMLNYVFRELRFKGDPVDYHHPDNALLHRVIDRRKGLPIMLSTVVMFLGNRLGLPFYGVNMPIHFILMYQTHDQDYLIDPFDGGSHVTYDQCCYFLKKNGIEPRPEHLERADELEILMRAIRNLQQSYSRGGDIRRAEDLENLVRLTELRD